MKISVLPFSLFLLASTLAPAAYAATSIPLTVNMSEAVTVTGTPRVAVDVGGVTRYATYTSGSGTSALIFTLTPQAGDIDLDGISLTSPLQLNGGTLKDAVGNDAVLTFTPPDTSGIKVNYPSLGMDFTADADGRYTLNGTVYNDLPSFLTATSGSFSRASTASYMDSAGVMRTATANTPRFDYDPTTHVAKGLLIEESRTNIARGSSDITSGWLVNAGLTKTSNAAIALNGANEAAYVQIASGSDKHVYQANTVSLSNGQMWTFSVWLWSNTISNLRLFVYTSSPLTNVSSNLITITNTPQRYSVSTTLAGLTTETILYIRVDTENASGELSSGDFYMWGAQLEQGKFPTSYIPNSATSTTRAADVLSIPVGSWFNASTGAMYAEAQPYNANSVVNGAFSPTIAAIIEPGGAYVSRLGRTQATPGQGLFQSSACGFSAMGTWNNATTARIAGAYAANDVAAVFSTNALNTCSTGTVTGGMTTLNIGTYYSNQGYWSSTISKLKYYPLRVSNAQLQLLAQ